MGKLENKKNHDHLFVDCIKYGILGLVLCAPLFSVLAKTCYVSFNKNANLSYSKGMTQNITKINTSQEIQEGRVYEIIYKDNQINGTSPVIRFSNLSFDFYEKYPTAPVEPYDGFLLVGTNNQIYWYYGNERWTGGGQFNSTTFPEGFSFTASATPNNNQLTNFNIYTITYQTLTLDNAFYYAIEELNDQPVFNWTKNTGMYTVIDGMTTGLEFGSNNVLALLLTYWVMNVLIFSIFNIILMVFDKIWCIFYKE